MHIPEVTEMLIKLTENPFTICTMYHYFIYCIVYFIYLFYLYDNFICQLYLSETGRNQKVHLAMEQQVEVRDHDAKTAQRGRGQKICKE